MRCAAALIVLLPAQLVATEVSAQQLKLGVAKKVTAVNSLATGEFSPSLSATGLELYFMGFGRSGGIDSDSDIWVARRDGPDKEFGRPVVLAINVAGADSNPDISGNGLSLFFDSARAGGYGGKRDIWVARRVRLSSSWATPVNLGPDVNSSGWEGRPTISSDGRILVFDRRHERDGTLWMSTRKTATGRFGKPIDLGISGCSPGISADGRFLFFMSHTDSAQFDLFVASRKSTADSFGEPARLGPNVNTAISEGDPDVSRDEKTLYFIRTDYSQGDDLVRAFLHNAEIWSVPIAYDK